MCILDNRAVASSSRQDLKLLGTFSDSNVILNLTRYRFSISDARSQIRRRFTNICLNIASEDKSFSFNRQPPIETRIDNSVPDIIVDTSLRATYQPNKAEKYGFSFYHLISRCVLPLGRIALVTTCHGLLAP